MMFFEFVFSSMSHPTPLVNHNRQVRDMGCALLIVSLVVAYQTWTKFLYTLGEAVYLQVISSRRFAKCHFEKNSYFVKPISKQQ